MKWQVLRRKENNAASQACRNTVPDMATQRRQPRLRARDDEYDGDEHYVDTPMHVQFAEPRSRTVLRKPPPAYHHSGSMQAPSRPTAFAHNYRIIAVLCVPSLVLLDLGGGTLRGTAALGLMTGYLANALKQDEACFVVLWLTVVVEGIGHGLNAILTFGMFTSRGMGLAALACTHVVLIGAWCSLQFEWLPAQYPELAVLFERLLFNVLPLPAAGLCTWGVAVFWDAEMAPWTLLTALGCSYVLIGGALPSSYGDPKERDARAADSVSDTDHNESEHATAGDGWAAACQAACVLGVPLLFYLGLHSPTLMIDPLSHALPAATMACAALLFLGLPSPEHASHWLRVEHAARARGPTLALAIVGLGVSAQRAIVADARARSRHSSSLMQVPDGWLGEGLVSLCVGSISALLLLHAALPRGQNSFSIAPLISFLCVSALCSLTFLLHLAAPYQLLGLIAAISGAHALQYKLASPIPCVVCGASLTAMVHGVLERTTGVVSHTFAVTGLSLRALSVVLVVMTGLCASAIALTRLCDPSPQLRSLCLLGHALLLALVEATLSGELAESGDAAYPAWLALLTFIGGLVLCVHTRPTLRPTTAARAEAPIARASPHAALSEGSGVAHGSSGSARHPTVWWLLLAAHGGRLALLVGAPASSYPDGMLLVAALTQGLPMQMTQRQVRFDGGRSVAPVSWLSLCLRLLLTAVASWRSHARLLPAIFAWTHSSPPAPPVGVGVATALFAAGAHGLSRHLPTAALQAVGVRLCAWVLAVGALLAAIQPVFDMQLLVESLVWTMLHPTASLTFGGTPRLLLWPPWLLHCLLMLVLAALLDLVPVASLSPRLKLLGCALAGVGACLTAFGALLPLERSLFLLSALAAALGGALIGMLIWPRALVGSPRAPMLVLSLFAAIFVVGLAAQSHVFHHSPAARLHGALASYRAAWLALYAGILATCALLARLHVALATRSGGAAAGAAAGSASHTARPWLATASASATLRAEADARRLAAQRGGIQWLPAVGNACVLAAYLLMLTINGYVLGGSARGGLPVAPLLLLHHPYTPPTWALNPSNRYAPVVSAALSTLAGAALFEVGRRVLKGGLTLSVLRAVALTSCAAPSLVLFTAFLWTWRQQSSLVLWCRPPPNAAPVLSHAPPPPLTTPRTPSPSPRCLLPLNTVPLLLSHARPLYDLGAAGLLAAAAHLLLAGQLRAESQRYL